MLPCCVERPVSQQLHHAFFNIALKELLFFLAPQIFYFACNPKDKQKEEFKFHSIDFLNFFMTAAS